MKAFFGSSKSADESRLDTTLRPICFGIDKAVTKASASSVGPEKFKKYEHALYVMAQLSRIVYCDTGIMWHVIQKSLGMSNDIVNKVITAYDSKYSQQKRQVVSSQATGAVPEIAMESYSLVPGSSGNKFGTYISTAEDMTCLFINASKIRASPNSIFNENDVVISFKGSSTAANFKHDLMSQFTAGDIGTILNKGGLNIKVGDGGNQNNVTGAFVNPLVNAWPALTKGLTEHCKNPGTRLFLTGHSLGGAYCSLFGFILAEAKVSGASYMQNIASIHIVSFGAPTILGDNARNTFNRHLDTGLMTVDRVVSQAIAARSAATQVLVGGPVGPSNVIPTIPAGFSHPGYRPLATEFRPEAGGRPYSIENIRGFFGAPSKTRYREPATWPFTEAVDLKGNELRSAVSKITSIDVSAIPEQTETTMPGELVAPITEGTNGEDPGAQVNGMKTPQPGLEDPGAMQNAKQKGGLGFTAAKRQYDQETVKHLPNFISVRGSPYASGFAHAEYLGMFFLGGFRLPGMKNPANLKTGIAFFNLLEDGVKMAYMPTSNSTMHGGMRKTLRNRKLHKKRQSRHRIRK